MASPGDALPEVVRRRLKRKRPGHAFMDDLRIPQDHELADVVSGELNSEPLPEAGAVRPVSVEDAIFAWMPPRIPNDLMPDPDEVELCRLILTGSREDADWRKAYKRMWMKLQRMKQYLSEKVHRNGDEDQFLSMPGSLFRAERIEVFLKLRGVADDIVRDMVHDGRGYPLLPEASASSRMRCRGVWVRERVLLLTYNGPWGTGWEAIMGGERDPERAAGKLRGHPVILKLAEAFRTRVQNLHTVVQNMLHWAFSVEICPETLASGQGTRVHIHLCLCAGLTGVQKLVIHTAEDVAFEDTVPVKSATMGAKISRGNINVAMFYVLVAKIGQVHAEGTCRLHKDLLVNPDWAFNLLQQGKVTIGTVRNVIIHCAKNVPRLLANLEGYELALRERAEDEHMQSMRATVSGAFRPFRRLPEVVLWLATFQRMVCRYKFLVLEGPSQLGKTQFAVSLADPGRTLIIDCSGATEADLRRYRSEAVDAILFDEGKASMVLRSKKLFQSPFDRIHLGQSNTNCHAYIVAVHAKRMIITSNTWSAELQQLPSVDVVWLRANSVHGVVHTPLWAESSRPSLCAVCDFIARSQVVYGS